MANETILQLGAGQLMTQSIRLLKQTGFQVYAVDQDVNAPGFSIADGYRSIDIVDVDKVSDYARDIGADVILAVNEAGVLAAAIASKQLGLPNISPDVAMNCLNKGLMRACWAQSRLPQPAYQVVNNRSKIKDAAACIGYPLILKPTMNWGSRGISIVKEKKDLPWSINFAQEHCRDGAFIVEKYVPGREMTIEGLVLNGQPQILAKSDKEHQDHQRFQVALALNYPAQFSSMDLAMADEVTRRAVQSLGIINGAFHAECKVNDKGLFLLEIGARGGGGHIFGHIVEAVSGVCMPRALVRILLGEDVDIKPRFQRGGCYKFFTPPSGVFEKILGVEEARQLPGIIDFGFTMRPGTTVGPIAGDADRPGYVVASGVNREEAMANANFAISTVQFIMSKID